jgi:sterol desaturase/sphingolipid hydroxylase (fatty acid hydroxylase superfamily)
MVEDIALFVAGVFVWTFLEYLIHGWLSHTFRTFAMPLHAVHHKDASAVFTIRAWVPTGVILAFLLLVFGWTPGTILFSGALAGFIAYEIAHYRIHFRRPGGGIEEYLRSRHLVHHHFYSNRCFGVTSAIWDLAFGTEPMGPEIATLRDSMRSKPPLTVRTNLYKLKYYIVPWLVLADVARRKRTK